MHNKFRKKKDTEICTHMKNKERRHLDEVAGLTQTNTDAHRQMPIHTNANKKGLLQTTYRFKFR